MMRLKMMLLISESDYNHSLSGLDLHADAAPLLVMMLLHFYPSRKLSISFSFQIHTTVFFFSNHHKL